ncbi:MAG: diguanylate cyclase [Fervidobacterium sp.]
MLKKVLIVDDSKFWRLVLEDMLKGHGYKILVAENGMNAIEVALKEFPNYIITDYNMPGISGLQLCLYLRSVPAFNSAGIAILTGSDDVINIFWAEHSGADKFISKLLPKTELEKVLLDFLSHDYYSESAGKSSTINTIYDVLEQKMRKEILNREILSFIQFARDELFVIKELMNFISNFSSFSAIAFLLLSPVEGRIYNFGFPLQKESLKSTFISFLEKPLEPSNWTYVGNYGSQLLLSGDFNEFVVNYEGNEVGAILVSNVADKWNLSKVVNEADESISLLFNTLNTFRELKVASTIDGLTGVFNKKELLRFLDETHSIYKASKKEYFVAMFDIDNFKKVNDTYGHLVGDEVLKIVGKILKDAVGDKGIVGRYGGEEFTLVLTKITSKDEVVELIEEILNTIRNTHFPHGKCTVSCGVVSSEIYQSPMEVIKSADDLLYISKKSGKDRASYMFLMDDNQLSELSK